MWDSKNKGNLYPNAQSKWRSEVLMPDPQTLLLEAVYEITNSLFIKVFLFSQNVLNGTTGICQSDLKVDINQNLNHNKN